MADENNVKSGIKSDENSESSAPDKRVKIIDGTEEEDNNESGSNFMLSLMDKALQNTLILEKIMSFLDVNSIKEARKVNSVWSIEGAKMLFLKCYVRIPWILNFFMLEEESTRTSEEMDEIDEFTTFLSRKSNDVSMVPNLIIQNPRDVKVWKSLGVVGPQVTSIKFDITDVSGDWLSNLLDLLPNLKSLSIKEYDGYGHGRLKILQAITSFITKAEKDPNRKSSVIISRMALVAMELQDLEVLAKLSDCTNIMIEKLEIDIHPDTVTRVPRFDHQIANIVSKLLGASQKVLQTLTLSSCELFLHLIDFPRMVNLTKLTLDFSHCRAVHVAPRHGFPPSFQFSENVPNLAYFKMNFCGSSNRDDFFALLFENTGKAPSLKRLKVMESHLDDGIKTLFQTFPRVEEFKLVEPRCTKKMFRALWKHGRNLKKLTLNINVNAWTEKINDLDYFFTGFSRNTVNKMKNKQKMAHYTPERLNKKRVHRSILNLKKLQELSINFRENGLHYLPGRFLEISGEHAFKLLPKDPKIFIFVETSRRALKYAEEALDQVSKLPNVEVGFDEILSEYDHMNSDSTSDEDE